MSPVPPLPSNLIHCTECGKQIARSAKVCPSCGAPRKKPAAWWKWVLWIFIIVNVLVGILAYIAYKQQNADQTPQPLAVDSQDGVVTPPASQGASAPAPTPVDAAQGPQNQSSLQPTAASAAASDPNAPCQLTPDNPAEFASMKAMVLNHTQPKAYFHSTADQGDASKQSAFILAGDEVVTDPVKVPNRNGMVCAVFVPEHNSNIKKATTGWLSANQLTDAAPAAKGDFVGQWENGVDAIFAITGMSSQDGGVGMAIMPGFTTKNLPNSDGKPTQMDEGALWTMASVPQADSFAVVPDNTQQDEGPMASNTRLIGIDDWQQHSKMGVCALAIKRLGSRMLVVMSVPSCHQAEIEYSGVYSR